jgi:hypothetical protein
MLAVIAMEDDNGFTMVAIHHKEMEFALKGGQKGKPRAV